MSRSNFAESFVMSGDGLCQIMIAKVEFLTTEPILHAPGESHLLVGRDWYSPCKVSGDGPLLVSFSQDGVERLLFLFRVFGRIDLETTWD